MCLAVFNFALSPETQNACVSFASQQHNLTLQLNDTRPERENAAQAVLKNSFIRYVYSQTALEASLSALLPSCRCRLTERH